MSGGLGEDEWKGKEPDLYIPPPPTCKEIAVTIFGPYLPCVKVPKKDPDDPGLCARICPSR